MGVLGYAQMLMKSAAGGATFSAFDPSKLGNASSLSSVNTILTGASGSGAGIVTGVSSGKYYCEFTAVVLTTNDFAAGIMNTANPSDLNAGSFIGATTACWGWLQVGATTTKRHSTSGSFGSSLSAGDVFMLALDITNGFLYTGKNGTWFNSGDPTSGATGTGAMFGSIPAGTYYFAASGWNTNGVKKNMTSSFTPPTGYTAI